MADFDYKQRITSKEFRKGWDDIFGEKSNKNENSKRLTNQLEKELIKKSEKEIK